MNNFKEKNYYKILDGLLQFYYDKQVNQKEDLLGIDVADFWGKWGYEITSTEKAAIVQKLKKDGYIDENEKLSVEGLIFIINGKYQKKKKNEYKKSVIDWIQIGSIIVGGSSASVYYLMEVSKYIHLLLLSR